MDSLEGSGNTGYKAPPRGRDTRKPHVHRTRLVLIDLCLSMIFTVDCTSARTSVTLYVGYVGAMLALRWRYVGGVV